MTKVTIESAGFPFSYESDTDLSLSAIRKILDILEAEAPKKVDNPPKSEPDNVSEEFEGWLKRMKQDREKRKPSERIPWVGILQSPLKTPFPKSGEPWWQVFPGQVVYTATSTQL